MAYRFMLIGWTKIIWWAIFKANIILGHLGIKLILVIVIIKIRIKTIFFLFLRFLMWLINRILYITRVILFLISIQILSQIYRSHYFISILKIFLYFHWRSVLILGIYYIKIWLLSSWRLTWLSNIRNLILK